MKIDESQLSQNIDSELLKRFVEAGVFYGRKKSLTNPKMKPYLIDLPQFNIEIFNLDLTKKALDEAVDYLKQILNENKTILFVGTKPAVSESIKEIATTLNQPYIVFRWPGGFLTNFVTIKARIDFMKNLENKILSGEIEKYPLKEKLRMKREYEKLIKLYEGVRHIEKIPDCLFIVDLRFKNHQTAYHEALRMKIPLIAICGSDNNPEGVTIVIPANDKAPRSVKFLINYLKERLI